MKVDDGDLLEHADARQDGKTKDLAIEVVNGVVYMNKRMLGQLLRIMIIILISHKNGWFNDYDYYSYFKHWNSHILRCIFFYRS